MHCIQLIHSNQCAKSIDLRKDWKTSTQTHLCKWCKLTRTLWRLKCRNTLYKMESTLKITHPRISRTMSVCLRLHQWSQLDMMIGCIHVKSNYNLSLDRHSKQAMIEDILCLVSRYAFPVCKIFTKHSDLTTACNVEINFWVIKNQTFLASCGFQWNSPTVLQTANNTKRWLAMEVSELTVHMCSLCSPAISKTSFTMTEAECPWVGSSRGLT